MKADRRTRRVTAKQAISLLSDPGFPADVKDVRVAFGWGSDDEEAVGEAEQERAEKRAAFKAKWSPIVPPPDGALLDDPAPNPRRPEATALLAGKWGIIRVFPWTTEKSAKLEFRAAIGRANRERKNVYRSEVALWLQGCEFSPRPRYCSGRCRAQASRDAKRQKILGHLRSIERLLEP